MNPQNRKYSSRIDSGLEDRRHGRAIPWIRSGLGLACLSLALILGNSAQAQQTVRLTANPIRFTIPVNGTGAYTNTVTVTVGNADGVTEVTLAPSGVPAGSAVTLDKTVFTNSGTATLILNYTNVPQGAYDMALDATSSLPSSNYRLPLPVYSVYMWNNAAGTTNFSDAGNWVGGIAPGATDRVGFDDAGVTTSATTPTVMINADTEVESIRLIHGGTAYHNFNIADGVTFSVTGTNGFYHLRDQLPASVRSYIAPQGAGTFVVSNANATFALLVDAENTQDIYQFGNLNTLKLDVSRIAIDDYYAYPNAGTNGNNTNPRRWSPNLLLAKTNLLRATLTDANDWTNTYRDYSFVIARSHSGGGTGTDFSFRLGLVNDFYMDSLLIGGAGEQCDSGSGKQVDFNPALTGAKSLVLRGPDGGRMSNFTLADAATVDGVQGSGTKIVMTLAGGSIDGLVDKLYLSRNATNVNGAQATSQLVLSDGTLDVNTAFLGYQTGTNLTAAGIGYCGGRIDVNGTSLFRVNDNLVLGYTEEAAGTTFQAEAGYGQVNVDGGTVMANVITVGGPSLATLNNANQKVSLSNGGTIIVSNTIATADARLNTLSMNNSTLGLFVDFATTTPYVYVSTLTTAGTSNVLNVVSITGSASFPVTVPLISYEGSAAPNFVLALPAGYYGYINNNQNAHTIDAIITTTPPKSLVWNGNVDGNWDTSTLNWQGGLAFTDGDSAIFDDTAAGSTSITIPGVVTPGSGGVLVSNDLKSYTFVSGIIGGTSLMTKDGTNSLTINADVALPLNVTAGILTGSGTVGATTIGADATLDFSGTINKLTTSGTSANSGTINIGLSVSGGTFDNAGTVNGTFATSGSAIVTNRAGATVNLTSGNGAVGAGTVLIQNGEFDNHSGRLAIAGALTGSGVVADLTGDVNGDNGRLEINGGGVFTPGGSNTIGIFTISGRFDLNAATPDGTMIIDVDMNNPQRNDYIGVDKWSNFRGALVMNNIGSIPFAAGQSFMICSNNFGLPNVPQAAFDLTNKITPKVPGVGLQWDVTNLKTNGIIAVVAVPATPPALTSVVTSTNITLSWPLADIGYQLQVQTNSLDVGLTQNWVPVAGSETNTSWKVDLDPTAPAVFYRLSNQ